MRGGIRRLFKSAALLSAAFLLSLSAASHGVLAAASSQEEEYKALLSGKGFPSSYLQGLWEVHKMHPQWEFRALRTGLDWDTAVERENAAGKNLVYIQPGNTDQLATRLYRDFSYGAYIKKGDFDFDYVVRDGNDEMQRGWIDASPMAVAFFMNPCGFIGRDDTILQFEELSFCFRDLEEAEGFVETVLTGSFMSKSSTDRNYVDDYGNVVYRDKEGSPVGTGRSFANIIAKAGKDHNVNPCFLASKIISEVGTGGSGSTLGLGFDGEYKGYYNYLNIGATDSSQGDAVKKGLMRAKSEGWDSPEKAIDGGAAFLSSSYIAGGQSTPYLQKFNVTANNTYGHQYMTAVNGAVVSTYNTYMGYKRSGLLDKKRIFSIPVFENMPDGSSQSLSLSGYTAEAKAVYAVNIRKAPRKGSDKNGTMAAGTTFQLLAGCRTAETESVQNRMYTPLWYKYSGGYLYEDAIETAASATLEKGKSLRLPVKCTGGAEKPRYMVLDRRIASIDKNGVITGKNTGSTKAVAYLQNGSFAVLKITVVTVKEKLPVLHSDVFSVNENNSYISKIPEGLRLKSLKEGLEIRECENGSLKVFRKENGKERELSAEECLATGDSAAVLSGSKIKRRYTVIVSGDLDGNGKISISDLLLLRDRLLKLKELGGVNGKAADLDGNGKISIADLLYLRDHLLRLRKIVPQGY